MYTRVSTTHRPTLINHRRSKIILYELREKKEAEFNKNNKVKCHNNAILFKKKNTGVPHRKSAGNFN